MVVGCSNVGKILCNDIGRGFHFSFRTLGPIESHSYVVTQDKKTQRPAVSLAQGWWNIFDGVKFLMWIVLQLCSKTTLIYIWR